MIHSHSSVPRPSGRAPDRRPLTGALAALLAVLLAACGTTAPGDGVADGFDLEVAREHLTLATGNSATVAVSVQRAGTFDAPVDVTVEGLPSGVTASQLTIGAGQSSDELLITVDASASPVTEEPITVTASGGGFTDSESFTLTVTDPGEGDPADAIDQQVTAVQGSEAVLADETSVASFVLAPGEDRLYRVNVSTSDEPALYLYLDQALDLYVYRGSGSLFATSSSSAYFAAASGGLDLAGGESTLDPQVVATETCPGSCVIMENPGAGTIYVRVHNDSATTRSFELWAVLRSFADTNEATATFDDPEPFETSAEGAIETIGDEDYFIVDQAGTLSFDFTDDAGTGLDLQAQVIPFGETTPVETIGPGESTTVDFSDIVVVTATNPRAAVSANSQYFLTLE